MNLLPASLLLPQRTVAAEGAVLRLTNLAAEFGSSGVLVHGCSLQRSELLDAILNEPPFGMRVRAWRHAGNEPTVDAVDALRADLKADRPDWVAAVGGGSVIDLAKAAAGFDAFVQAFESYTSLHATPFTRVLSELALTRIARALLPFYQGNSDLAGEMLEASYLAGVALSHARLGIIHGLAHPLGVRFNVAHGLACACCLPACLAFNRKAVARDLNTLKSQHGLDVEAQIAMWMTAMELKNPFAGQQVTDREAFIRETLASGSTAANPRPVTADDVSSLLDTILEKTATTPA